MMKGGTLMPQPSQRRSTQRQSAMMAFCGMAAALSIAVMLLGTMIPAATYAVPLFCGLLLLPVMLEFGRKAAWLTYAATTIIAILLGLDKEAAFFYLFLGWYPLVKWQLDAAIHSKPLNLLIKLTIFTAALAAMYSLLAFVLHLDAITQEFSAMGPWLLIAFALIFDLCMLLYDRVLFPMAILYTNRIKPKLKFLRR